MVSGMATAKIPRETSLSKSSQMRVYGHINRGHLGGSAYNPFEITATQCSEHAALRRRSFIWYTPSPSSVVARSLIYQFARHAILGKLLHC